MPKSFKSRLNRKNSQNGLSKTKSTKSMKKIKTPQLQGGWTPSDGSQQADNPTQPKPKKASRKVPTDAIYSRLQRRRKLVMRHPPASAIKKKPPKMVLCRFGKPHPEGGHCPCPHAHDQHPFESMVSLLQAREKELKRNNRSTAHIRFPYAARFGYLRKPRPSSAAPPFSSVHIDDKGRFQSTELSYSLCVPHFPRTEDRTTSLSVASLRSGSHSPRSSKPPWDQHVVRPKLNYNYQERRSEILEKYEAMQRKKNKC